MNAQTEEMWARITLAPGALEDWRRVAADMKAKNNPDFPRLDSRQRLINSLRSSFRFYCQQDSDLMIDWGAIADRIREQA